jgi:hypothetical protein
VADNVAVTPGTGETIAADDIAGVKHQRVKVSLGADGSATDALGGAGAVAAGVQRMTLASDDPAVVKLTTIDADTSTLAGAVSGTEMQVDVLTSALPSGAATSANQTAPQADPGLDATKAFAVQGVTDGLAVPISAGSLPLPSGAATEATLTTIGGYLDGVEGKLDTMITSLQILDDTEVAHDAAFTGESIAVGGKAVTALSGLTLVAANDKTNGYFDLDGAQHVREVALADLVSGVAAITDGSSTSVIASAGAGVRNYITDISIANTSATPVTVDIRDGTAGAVLWTGMAPAGGGLVKEFKSPLKGTAATAVAADPSAAASTVTVSLGGFKSKVG